MNIIKEQKDDLNAVIKIQLKPEDYQGQVEKTLKDHQKKMRMPGFREGKVPVSLVKKMYGKTVLVEEINKILSDSLYRFISENKLDVLGNPLPKADESKEIDWDHPSEFEFAYDLGFAPQFDIQLEGMHFPYYKVRITEELVEKYIKEVRQRHGKFANPETSGENDMLFGEFIELDPFGNELEGGIRKNSSILMSTLKTDSVKQKLTGISKDQEIVLAAPELKENFSDLSLMLGIENGKADQITSSFKFRVLTVSSLEPADLNQELYDALYGSGIVSSEPEFRAKVKEELQESFSHQSDARLINEVMAKLVSDLNLSLPDEFLKRWLMAVNEKPVTQDQLEKEYPAYAGNLKRQLIENKIMKENGITVTTKDSIDFIKEHLYKQFEKYGQEPKEDEEMEKMAHSILAKKEESEKIYQLLSDRKMKKFLKSKLSLDFIEVSEEEFFEKK